MNRIVNRVAACTARRALRSCQAVERLEDRRLLATIGGLIFEDINGNRDFNAGEDVQDNVAVYLDLNFNDRLDDGEPTTTSDAEGFYEFDNLLPGTYVVKAIAPEGQVQTFPGAGGFSKQSDFDIDIRFQDNGLTPAQQQLVLQSANRWEQLIVGELPDFDDPTLSPEPIDDILIDVFSENNAGNGRLGFANNLRLRPDGPNDSDTLPYYGNLTLNTAFASDLVGFRDTILHEMGHVLGAIEGIYAAKGIATGVIRVGGGPFGARIDADPRLIGENSVREYNDIFSTVPGFTEETGVPLEDVGQVSHLREETFDAMNMTPEGESFGVFEPTSRITLALFDDIGYDVDYSQADAYIPPGGAGTVDQPLAVANSGIERPFSITIVANEDTIVNDANFGHRPNTNPSLVRLQATSVNNPESEGFSVVNNPVRLEAVGAFDPDDFAGDLVTLVAFYQESNNIPGLQTKGINADTYLAVDGSRGRFKIFPEPGTVGEATFYARGYDRALAVSRTVEASIDVIAEQTIPAKPVNLQTRALGATSILATWDDRSVDETGFRVEISPDFDFRDESGAFTLLVGENVEAVEFTGLVPGQTYFSRVRAFNTAGSSRFAGRPAVTTLGPGEILLDPTMAGRSVIPFQGTVDAGNLTFLQGPAGFNNDFLATTDLFETENALVAGDAVVYTPVIASPQDYFVFVFNPGGTNPAVPISINGETGIIDQTRNGGFQLLGRYGFEAGGGNRIVLGGDGQPFLADAVRLIPTAQGRTAQIAFNPAGRAIADPRANTLFPSIDPDERDDFVGPIFAG